VPAEFLAMHDFSQACGLALLHDVPVRPMHMGENLRLASSLSRILDDFGRKDAEWLPYWRNDRYVSAAPADFVISLYRHPKHGVLAQVFNAGPHEIAGEVTLNFEALGLTGTPAARDAFSGEAIAINGGRLRFTLPSLGWRLVRVEGEGS